MDTMSLSGLFIIATWRTNGCSFTNHNRQDPYFRLTLHDLDAQCGTLLQNTVCFLCFNKTDEVKQKQAPDITLHHRANYFETAIKLILHCKELVNY